MNTEHFKEKLAEEQGLLTTQLGDIAVKDPVSGLWAAKAADMDTATPQSEPNEAADKIEELDERGEEVVTLSARLTDVERALEHIDAGTYGICEVCNKAIDEERLEANPAARTCQEHM